VTPSVSIGAAIAAPVLGALAVSLSGRAPNVRESFTMITTLITFGLVAGLVPEVMSGARPELVLIELLPGLSLRFEVEPLGMLYALVASGLWIVTSLYAFGYMRGHHEGNQTRFYVCFALAISAALGIAFAGNLLTLFIFYEVLTFSTYPLVTHRGTDEARRGGRTYLGVLVTTSICFLLFGIVWTYALTGTLDFESGGILAGSAEPWQVPLLLALFVLGIGKAATMPFHRWLPAAMVAPTTVSALLHAVAVVKAGVFSVLKVVVYVFGIDLLSETGGSVWLMYLAASTILISSLIALYQDNLKRRLAYSTISQLAYIVLGGALATASGVLGGALHIAMHAVGKITLFFCAGAIDVAQHKQKVSELRGIGRSMPFTMAAFALGSFSIIGLPPFGGAWSKWYLALGSAEGPLPGFMVVYMLSSLLSIGYLMPIVVRAFFFSPDGSDGESAEGTARQLKEAPLLCVVPLCLTAIGSVLIFFYAPRIEALLRPLVGG